MNTDASQRATIAPRTLHVSAQALRTEGDGAQLGLSTHVPFRLGDEVLVVVRDTQDEVLGQVRMVVIGRRAARPGKRLTAGVVVSPRDANARTEIARLRLLVGAPQSEVVRFASAAEATSELRAVAVGGVGLFPIEGVVAAKSILALVIASPDAPHFRFTAEAAFSVDSDKKRFAAVRAASDRERLRVAAHVKQVEQIEQIEQIEQVEQVEQVEHVEQTRVSV